MDKISKQERPILTIAIPTYNGAGTICNLLNLLLPQVNNSDEVEVIISDNCSIDKTPEIVAEYRSKYSFVQYVRNKTNIKTDGNILQCCRLARGKYIWHLSDDDVVIENSLDSILSFLRKYDDLGLIYLTTGDFRGKYNGVEECQFHEPIAKNNLCTTDKKTFINYAGYYWGFMSSFVSNTDKIKSMDNPEQYMHTYWLQSYLHAWCASGNNTKLGVVSTPTVGAGIYVNNPNFDSSLVNGVYYKAMVDYMISKCDFDEHQMYDLYMNRLLLLGRHDLFKEKASGVKRLNKKRFFNLTKKSVKAWFTVYPLFIIPNKLCSFIMSRYRKKKHLNKMTTNRPE